MDYINKVEIYLEAVRAYKNFDELKALELFISIADYNDSEEYIEEILRNDTNKEKLYLKAIEYYEQNNLDDALMLFERILEYKESQNYKNEILSKNSQPVAESEEESVLSRFKGRIIGSAISIIAFAGFVIFGMMIPLKEYDYFESNVPTLSQLPLTIIFTILVSVCFIAMLICAIIANEKKVKYGFKISFISYVVVVLLGLSVSLGVYDEDYSTSLTFFYSLFVFALIIPAIAMYYGVYLESDTSLDEWPSLFTYFKTEDEPEEIKKMEVDKLKKLLNKLIPIIFGSLLVIGIILFTILFDTSRTIPSILLMILPIAYILFSNCTHLVDGICNGFEEDVKNVSSIALGLGVGLPFSVASVPASFVFSLSNIFPIVGPLFVGIPLAVLFYALAASVAAVPAVIFLIVYSFMGLYSPFKLIKKDIEGVQKYIINGIILIVLISMFVVRALM